VALLSHAETPLDIGRSAADIYAYLADFTRHVEWAHTYLSVEVSGDAPLRVGSLLRVSERQDLRWDKRPRTTIGDREGRDYTTTLEIAALNPAHRIGWGTLYVGGPLDGVRGEWELVLEPVLEAITIVRFRADLLEPTYALVAFGEALLAEGHPIDVLARQVDRAAHNIRTILEGRA
jgi:hypothetical protein